MDSQAKRIEALKAQYEAQPLPPMLEERIRASMKQAAHEGTNNAAPRRGSARKNLYRGLGAMAAALAVVTLLANASPATARAMQRVPVLGPIAKLLTFRTYADSQYGVEARIAIPQLDALESPARENLQSAVDAYAQALIAQHEEAVAATGEAIAQDPALMAESQAGHQSLETFCDVAAETGDLFCLRMTTDLTMASGAESRRHFVLDKRTGEVLALGDLFKPGSGYEAALVAEVQAQMAANAAKDDSHSYFPEEVAVGPAQDFYITGGGQLVLCFDEYTVAPGYMGPQDFVIPTSALAGMLDTDLMR